MNTIETSIVDKLYDLKAEDVLVIDLSKTHSLFKKAVIANGRSSKHVHDISQKLLMFFKHEYGIIAKNEGNKSGTWETIDVENIIIHIFQKETRDLYRLEDLYSKLES